MLTRWMSKINGDGAVCGRVPLPAILVKGGRNPFIRISATHSHQPQSTHIQLVTAHSLLTAHCCTDSSATVDVLLVSLLLLLHFAYPRTIHPSTLTRTLERAATHNTSLLAAHRKSTVASLLLALLCSPLLTVALSCRPLTRCSVALSLPHPLTHNHKCPSNKATTYNGGQTHTDTPHTPLTASTHHLPLTLPSHPCPLSTAHLSHRTGTRAGFVDQVLTTADDVPDNVFGGRSFKSGRQQQSLSNQHPAYLIRQEKDGGRIVKGHDMVSAVKGDKVGASEEEIVAADRETKAAKRGGKKNVEESESKENLAEKKRLMDGSVEKMQATKRARGTAGDGSASNKGDSKKKQKK